MRRNIGPVLVSSCLCWALLGLHGALCRQVPQPDPPPPVDVAPPPGANQPPTTLVVTGTPQTYTSAIGRRSYSTSNDLEKSTGSLADLLRNIPSIQVDSSGVVSLRGDPSVTILVDGKPSALLSGASRAEMLLQLPASQYDRVEVLTTPSAAYNPEGSGGVINLISRKSAPTGSGGASSSASVDANLGTGGRASVGATGVFKTGRLSLNGGVNFRRTETHEERSSSFIYGGQPIGAPVAAAQETSRAVQGNVLTANGGAEFDLDARTRLSGTVSLLQDRSPGRRDLTYSNFAESAVDALAFGSSAGLHQHYSSNSGAATVDRKLSGDNEAVSLQINASEGHGYITAGTTYAYTAPAQPDLFQSISEASDFQQADIKAEYKRLLPNKAKLVMGVEVQGDHGRSGASGREGDGPSTTVVVPALSDLFKANQLVNGLYGTYEQTVGKFTFLPGLRLEETTIDTDQITLQTRSSQNYFGAFPTLQLTYDLGKVEQLKFSYGRRIERPGTGLLDPFRLEITALHFFSGNPDLKPAITNSLELGYEYHKKEVNYQATLYYRDSVGLFSLVTRDLGAGVLLDTLENVGHSRNAGMELVANRSITKLVTINASTNISWSELDASNLGIAGYRSAVLASGRVSLNWQATKRDFVQFSGQASGKRLTAQGYQDSYTTLNVGWRHTFDKKISSVVTLQDPFDSYREVSVINTTSLRSRETAEIRARALFVGFTYAFGGESRSAAKGFDFGHGVAALN